MKHATRSCEGAVLVFALLVLVVGAGVLGGVAQLAVTQALSGRAEWESAARRIRLENSRALARQYIISRMWRDFGGVAQGTLGNSVTGGRGGFRITNVEPAFGYWFSLQQDNDDRINPFNLFERGGFQSAWIRGFLRSGTDDSSNNIAPWAFQIRTRSPIAAGFAFVNHRPANNSWQPSPRIDLTQTNYAVGFDDLPRMPVSSVTNTNTGDTNGFLGFLLLPTPEADFGLGGATNAPVFASTSTATNLISPTNAAITIDLDVFDYGTGDSPRLYEVPDRVDLTQGGATNYAVAVTGLVLRNSAGSGTSFKTSAVQIVIPESSTNLTTVTLEGANTRETYLYRRGAGSPLLAIATSPGAPRTFRIGMTLDCPADFRIQGTLTIAGGIRTGRSLSQSVGNALVLEPVENPSWRYDAIADRMMWLEDQRER